MELEREKSCSVRPMPDIEDPFITRPLNQSIPHPAPSQHLKSWSRSSSGLASSIFTVPEHPPHTYSSAAAAQSPTKGTPIFNVPVYRFPDTTAPSQLPASKRTISGPPGACFDGNPFLARHHNTQATHAFPFPLQPSPSARHPLSDIKNLGTPRAAPSSKTGLVAGVVLASSPSPITPPKRPPGLKRTVSSPARLNPNRGPLSSSIQRCPVYRLGFSSKSMTGNAPFGLFRLRLPLFEANIRARLLAQECCGVDEKVLLDGVGDEGQDTWVVKRMVRSKKWEARMDEWEVVVRVVVYAWEGD